MEAGRFHHGDTKSTEKEIHFFVYREIPIDEKTLLNRIHDTGLLLDGYDKVWNLYHRFSMIPDT